MKAITWTIGILGIIACASAAILFAITPAEHWGGLPGTGLGAVIAAAIAGVVALAATESVASRRRHEVAQAINEKRTSEYAKTIDHLTRGFTVGTSALDEGTIRAGLSLWGSTEVLQEFRKYREHLTRIRKANANSANPGIGLDVPAELKGELQLLVARIAVAMRTDVMNLQGIQLSATEEDIAKAIFDDFKDS